MSFSASAAELASDLLDAAPDAMLAVDADGRMLLVNRQVEALFGYTRQELVGQYVEILVPERLRTTHVSHRTVYMRAPRVRAMGEGYALFGRRKDGTELIVMSRHALERNSRGEPVAILEINQDVSAARRADQALRDSEERFRLLVDGARDYALFLLSPDGRVSTWNAGAQRLKGYASAEIIGQHFSRFYTPEDVRAGKPEQLLQLAASEGRAHAEGWRVRHDGSRFWAEVAISVLRDDATGEVRGFAKLTRDSTERKENEDRLEQIAAELARSNAELEQFAYVASHDLQEPLRMVASYTELLRRRYANKLDEDADEFIDYAVDGAHRMQALINGLLMYARVGSRPLAPVEVNANQVVDAVLTDLAAAIAESATSITCEPLPTVIADPTQLHQLFQNLIANAIKFRGSAAPVVHVGLETLPNEWIFSVQDQGIGIPGESLDRIFMIFQRLHTREEYDGTGIGLAVCKRVVERMGGRIWVESEPGAGTTFSFTLARDTPRGTTR